VQIVVGAPIDPALPNALERLEAAIAHANEVADGVGGASAKSRTLGEAEPEGVVPSERRLL
jgi:hypothetical protein